MSQAPTTEKLMELLTACYPDIVLHAREDQLPLAEKNYYSTRDYALGDTAFCTAEAAIESCFPPGALRSVFENIDKVAAEIKRLNEANRPNYLRNLAVLVGLIVFVGMAVRHL